jgi:hypothetical protein
MTRIAFPQLTADAEMRGLQSMPRTPNDFGAAPTGFFKPETT